MGDSDNHSRLNKYDKRRKNTKLISILLILGAILVLILIGMWIFGGNGEEESDEQNEQSAETTEQEENTEAEDTEDDVVIDEGNDSQNDASDEGAEGENEDQETNEEASEDEDNDEVETEQVEPSDDNVSEAYTGNWDPVGTEQEGPHTTDYSDGSQDRIEIDQAASVATGLDQSNMATYWVGNDGDQQVIATVGNADQEAYYRVFLSWVDNEGWQPTKVEVLNELEY
ncbi:DUF1510 family protein [Virgibacillus sp. NKC19-16]|uniref:YrrS family protein n=1 Tax=Virgibacillus salidurans TaxID=2831673 RepID=UPI001F2A3D48|nr:DUF1510 family protein [Virgibacillus sp. NKC19-16]UJL44917.1 DUF1510 family protein [Virgibacillus sp. NKC19-16]